MKIEEFKKGIEEFRKTRLTSAEKSEMLEKIFEAPIESPYWSKVFQKPMAFALLSAFLLISGSATAYNANSALSGDMLYPMKTQVFEPILDQINTSPLEKLEWEEKKVERRIMEAEELANKNELDEHKTLELEKKIEKSSAAFSVAAQKIASSTATTTSGRDKQVEEFKKAFRKKLEEKKPAVTTDDEEDDNDKGKREDEDDQQKRREKNEKIKRLKDRAVRALEEGDDDGSESRSDRGEKDR